MFYFTYNLQFTIQDIIDDDVIMDNDCNGTELSETEWAMILLYLAVLHCCCCFFFLSFFRVLF